MKSLLVLTAPILAFVCYTASLPPFIWLLILPVIYIFDRLLVDANKSPFSRDINVSRFTLYIGTFVHLTILFWGLGQLASKPFNLSSASLLFSTSMLAVAASSAPVGHELIHKRNALDKLMGALIFSSICFPSFVIEHLRGHHVDAATPLDADSADKGQSYYGFLLNAVPAQFKKAYLLERKRLQTLELPFFHWKNELLHYCSITFCIAVTIYLNWHSIGLMYFLLYSAIAISSIEMIQYMSHYGLKRQISEEGKYTRTTREHSWNSNGMLTDLLSLSIQKHSAHHEMPTEYFHGLDVTEDSPLMPQSYYLMFAVALFPALWFKIMNPRVDAVMAAYQEKFAQIKGQENPTP